MEIKAQGKYSPKLKRIVTEIEAIMKREDVGGLVILNDGDGHGEYRMFIDTPSWSTLSFTLGGIVKVRMKAHMKSKKVATARTVNMIYNQVDVLAFVHSMMGDIKKLLSRHMDVEETGQGFYHGPGDA